MSLTPELTADQIDDWFRIGKKSVSVKGIPRSSSGGRFIDPTTLQPRAPTQPKVPSYKRQPTFHGGCDYAAQYQQEEEEKLMARSICGDKSDVASILSSRLEALELDSTIAASSVLPSDLAPPNANDIYNHFNFQHQYDAKLPITHFKEQIISTVESNQVTVIQGETGSGKTTQVAQYILDHYAEQSKYCNIIVTQPRRIAAISIARRVCQERGWQLGDVCGYQVGLDRTAGENTRLLYCTTGILLNKLINDKNMHKFTHVILDEVHERDQDTDFCLLVVRKLLRTNSPHTRVVLMSATFDSHQFAQYFALPVRDKLEQAPVVNVQGKPYRVSEFYAEDLRQLGEVPNLDESEPTMSTQAMHLAIKLVEEFDRMEEKEQGLSPTGFAHVRGTVLMFLPGLGEITALEEALVKLQDRHRLFIIPLHSTITMDEQNNVFCQPEPGVRKVILSTNIAESSITVPDIKYVIDFCLTKNLMCDFETNYTSLQINWASKANCIQRKGRAGRVSNGRVYRLVTRPFFESYLPEYTIPEMQRCPLDKLILQVKVLNLGEPKAILALALSPPNLDDIERNILLLKELGALSTSVISHYGVNRHDGELTFVGRVLADLPVDIKIGKLLILGHVFGLLEECLIMGAAMSQKSVFSKPFKQKLEAYRHKLEWSSGSLSDSLAVLYAFKNWERKKEMGEFRRAVGGGEKMWANQHYLQIRRLREVKDLIKELEKHLLKFNIELPRHEPHYKRTFSEAQEILLLKLVLCGAFYPNYFCRREIDELESHKSLSGKNPLNTVMVKGLPANHSHLYKQAVEDLFRKYVPNPRVTFEETRAYIEFPWRQANKSKVHPGVYLALKMKQLRMPLTVDIQHQPTAPSNQSASATAQGQLNADRRGDVLETHEMGSSRVGKRVPMPRADQDVVRVFISHVEECGHFWIQYSEPDSFNQLREVQMALNRERGLNLKPFSTKVRVGVFCVAPFHDQGEEEYYRGHVMSVYNKYDERLQAQREVAEVFFMDYGNVSVIPTQDLRLLSSELLNVPFQAVECQLIKVRPSPIRCPDGLWTIEASEMFKQTVLNQELYIRPYSVVHGLLRVELVHTSPFQYYVSQRLIEEGYADEAEESNLSKQMNEKRLEAYALMRNQAAPTYHDTEMPIPHRTLAEVAAATRQAAGSHPFTADEQRKTRINLTGPTNPYEMSFSSLTSVGRLRSVRVEQDSVNSVCIDDEPSTPHQRLMVAGFVGLSGSGTTMLVRDTTLMPLLPGLVHLVPLIFTPVAEFRVDEKKTRYTGALCGLGIDPDSGHSLLPDNDMELVFDIKISQEDIVKINAVRLAINFAIGSRDAVLGWGEGAIYEIQKRARESLMNLIQTRREPCEPVSTRHPFQWNCLDPEDIFPPTIEDQGAATLLELHSAVYLDDTSIATEITAEAEQLLTHLRYLREVVQQRRSRQVTVCELCNVQCPSYQLLALHLETQRHKTHEETLLKQYPTFKL